jgi:hypothetical protein
MRLELDSGGPYTQHGATWKSGDFAVERTIENMESEPRKQGQRFGIQSDSQSERYHRKGRATDYDGVSADMTEKRCESERIIAHYKLVPIPAPTGTEAFLFTVGKHRPADYDIQVSGCAPPARVPVQSDCPCTWRDGHLTHSSEIMQEAAPSGIPLVGG